MQTFSCPGAPQWTVLQHGHPLIWAPANAKFNLKRRLWMGSIFITHTLGTGWAAHLQWWDGMRGGEKNDTTKLNNTFTLQMEPAGRLEAHEATLQASISGLYLHPRLVSAFCHHLGQTILAASVLTHKAQSQHSSPNRLCYLLIWKYSLPAAHFGVLVLQAICSSRAEKLLLLSDWNIENEILQSPWEDLICHLKVWFRLFNIFFQQRGKWIRIQFSAFFVCLTLQSLETSQADTWKTACVTLVQHFLKYYKYLNKIGTCKVQTLKWMFSFWAIVTPYSYVEIGWVSYSLHRQFLWLDLTAKITVLFRRCISVLTA